jgi:hypothetical protein
MSDDDILTEPNISASEDHQQALANLKKVLENPDFLNYSELLDQDADKEGINIKSIDPTDFEQEEQNLEKERIMALTEQAKAQHDYQLNLLSKEQKARKKLHKQYKKQNKRYQALKENSAHAHQLRQVEVSKIWRRKELDVKTELIKKNADVQVEIFKRKEKDKEDQLVMGGISRVYKLTWRGRPQVVEIRIDQCRDIKDKLERGTYFFRVSTKDKIGGKILQYTYLTDEWCNISNPYQHDGRHSSRVIRFKANLKVLVPSKLQMLPTMVYCFQILDSNSVIVAEGYFPIIDNLFEISQGKFKVPLLRSSIRNTVDKFSGIEQLYRKNIDEWLCNLYFQVTVLPQTIHGESDYSVELKGDRVIREELITEPDQKQYEELIAPEQYSEYKHSVAKSGVLITPKNKFEFIYSEIITEFGFKFYKHWATYFTFILLILMIWLSRYLHFAGQWLYLKAESFPVSDFKVLLFTAELRYESQTKLRHEVLILIIGTIFILFWFLCMCLWAFLSLLLIGRFPHVCFRIIMAWGLVMIFDPLITVVEAIIYGFVYDYWEVDPFRMYNYFERAEGNGVVGALLTIFLYAGLTGLCVFIFYNYFLFLHMNGRLLDIYMRLNGGEERFFVPHDGEVSKRYLEWVCYKAKNYHSMNGDTRKVCVFNYQMFDGFNLSVTKTAIHVLIYTVGNDRSRELYRHFLRLPDGAITELSLNEHAGRSTFSQKYNLSPSLKSRSMTLRGYD